MRQTLVYLGHLMITSTLKSPIFPVILSGLFCNSLIFKKGFRPFGTFKNGLMIQTLKVSCAVLFIEKDEKTRGQKRKDGGEKS